jgi:hypothetical protein
MAKTVPGIGAGEVALAAGRNVAVKGDTYCARPGMLFEPASTQPADDRSFRGAVSGWGPTHLTLLTSVA